VNNRIEFAKGFILSLLIAFPTFGAVLPNVTYYPIYVVIHLACFIIGVKNFLAYKNLIKARAVCVVVVLLMLFLVLSRVFQNYDGEYGFEKINTMIYACLVYMLIMPFACSNKNNLRNFLIAIGGLSVIYALIIVITSGSFSGRGNIFYTNPIWSARVIGWCGILAVVYLFIEKRNRGLVFWATIFVYLMSYFAMLTTGSKGPVLSLFIVSLCIGISKFNLKIALWIYFLLAMFSIFVLFSDFKLFSIIELAGQQDRFSSSGVQEKVFEGVRVQLYNMAFELGLNNPLGVGFGGAAQGNFLYPHNLILELYAELGIGGLLVSFVMLWIALPRIFIAFRSTQWSLQVVGALFLFGFFNAMVSGDMTSPKFMYLCLCILFLTVPRSYTRQYKH